MLNQITVYNTVAHTAVMVIHTDKPKAVARACVIGVKTHLKKNYLQIVTQNFIKICLNIHILFNKTKSTLILRRPFCHKQKMRRKGWEEKKGKKKHP